jgi:hypothetical protein
VRTFDTVDLTHDCLGHLESPVMPRWATVSLTLWFNSHGCSLQHVADEIMLQLVQGMEATTNENTNNQTTQVSLFLTLQSSAVLRTPVGACISASSEMEPPAEWFINPLRITHLVVQTCSVVKFTTLFRIKWHSTWAAPLEVYEKNKLNFSQWGNTGFSRNMQRPRGLTHPSTLTQATCDIMGFISEIKTNMLLLLNCSWRHWSIPRYLFPGKVAKAVSQALNTVLGHCGHSARPLWTQC